jgi:hypothetical protein
MEQRFQEDEGEPQAFRLPQLREIPEEQIEQEAQSAEHTLHAHGVALASLQKHIQRTRRLNRYGVAIVVGFLLLLLSMLPLSIISPTALTILASLIGVGSAAFLVKEGLEEQRVRRRLRDQRAELEDKRLVGPLLETLALSDGEIRFLCMEVLASILPQLQASDAHLLTSQHRAILARQMFDVNLPMKQYAQYLKLHTAFTVAALQALSRIGDKSMLPVVERLADPTNPDAATRLAAQDCLPLLRERIQNSDDSHSLLRAAGASSTSDAADILLRPATASPSQTDPQHLLRASDREKDEGRAHGNESPF